MEKKSAAAKGEDGKILPNNDLQVIDLQKNSPNPYKITLPRNKKFNSKDILRLHSNLIKSFINGSIESNEAKTLSYLCSNYLQALQGVEVEERLKTLEEKFQDEKL